VVVFGEDRAEARPGAGARDSLKIRKCLVFILFKKYFLQNNKHQNIKQIFIFLTK